jgi:hypothetical protein
MYGLQVRNEKLSTFLSRDFASEANRTAALKNGYALLGQQRHELAAAFFVLGGSVRASAAACNEGEREVVQCSSHHHSV